MGAYLGGEHQLVSEALQVDTQDLEEEDAARHFTNVISENFTCPRESRIVRVPLANFAFYRI